MITFACLHCGKTFTVADELAGRRGKCKACQNDLVVPAVSRHISPQPALAQPIQPVEPENEYRVSGYVSPAAASSYEVSSAASGSYEQATTAPGKLPVRIRRLMADADQMARGFQNSPLIRIKGASGNPPELYHVEYFVRGLARGAGNTPVIRENHVVEIQLTREYPRQSPKCKMLTPVFHPNIEPAAICVGDHWTAAERLVDLVLRIGEMIAYQAYNIKSPLDGEAAMWADMNRIHLPIDRRDLCPPELG